MSDVLVNVILELQEERALAEVRDQLRQGRTPLELLESARLGMEKIGKRFEAGESYLSELLMATHIFKQAAAVLQPALKAAGQDQHESKGVVVMGTPQGDIHDLGKNIASSYLEIQGFEVHDLGVDVPVERFVDAVRLYKPHILGMSCLITSAYEPMRALNAKLKELGLRDNLYVIIGGGAVNPSVVEYSGADGYARDPVDGFQKAMAFVTRSR